MTVRVRVKIDREKLHAMIDRQVRPGMQQAADLMASSMRTAAPAELQGLVTTEVGSDGRGYYARTGLAREDLPPKRWHQWTGAAWQIVGFESRRTKPLPLWRLYEYRSKTAPARPFIRPALWGQAAEVVRRIAGR